MKMSEADKKLEKDGIYKFLDNDKRIAYENDKLWTCLDFDKENQEIRIDFEYRHVPIKVLKAIIEKTEEMGWEELK